MLAKYNSRDNYLEIINFQNKTFLFQSDFTKILMTFHFETLRLLFSFNIICNLTLLQNEFNIILHLDLL